MHGITDFHEELEYINRAGVDHGYKRPFLQDILNFVKKKPDKHQDQSTWASQSMNSNRWLLTYTL